MTACECPLAGYCQRHGVKKRDGWHKLCQTRENYYQAWEDGRGPGQATEDTKSARKRTIDKLRVKKQRLVELLMWLRVDSDKGVGDTVERLLAKVGGGKIKSLIESLGGSCGCTDRQKWLNEQYPY